jgi:hypothetical protein
VQCFGHCINHIRLIDLLYTMKFIAAVAVCGCVSVRALLPSLTPTAVQRSLQQAAAAVLLSASVLATPAHTLAADTAKPGLLRVQICEVGVGDGCDTASEGNELIQRLQRQSAEKREQRREEMLDDYNKKNFGDYFRAENKHMVRKGVNSYEIMTNAQYAAAEKAGLVYNDKFVQQQPAAAASSAQ